MPLTLAPPPLTSPPAATAAYRALYQAADAQIPAWEATLAHAWTVLRDQYDAAALTAALAAGDRAGALLAIDWPAHEADLRARLGPLVRALVWQGGTVAERALTGAPLPPAAFAEPPTLGVTLAFDLLNPQALAAIDAGTGDLITQISAETRAGVREVLRRAFQQGLGVPQQARLIAQIVGLTAQGAGAVASHEAALLAQGQDAATAAGRSQQYAARLRRQRATAIARTECLPGDTPVDGAVVVAAYRRWYEGPMVEILTSGGRKFAATPNHPMLTRRGWVPAGEITPLDDLIRYRRHEHAGAARDQNVDAPPATISQIFNALAAVGVVERERGRKPDFHGDGMEGEVDVLRPHRPLAVGTFAPLYQPVIERLLAPARMVGAPFCGRCGRLLSIDQQPCLCWRAEDDTGLGQAAIDHAPGNEQGLGDGAGRLAGRVATSDGRGIDVSAVVGRPPAALKERGAGRAARANSTGLLEDLPGPFLISAQRCGNLGDAHAGAVELDRVVAVTVRPWAGHVYNLSTPYGYFRTNGVYTGNTIRAANLGQQLLWRQAATQGLLLAERVRRSWIVTPDDKLCPLCRPLHEQTVPLDQPFMTARGPVMTPPLHPRCRCALALVDAGAAAPVLLPGSDDEAAVFARAALPPGTPPSPYVGLTYTHPTLGQYQIVGESTTKFKVDWLTGPHAGKTGAIQYVAKPTYSQAIASGSHQAVAPPAPPTPSGPVVGQTYQHHTGASYLIVSEAATQYKIQWLTGPGASKTTHGPGIAWVGKPVLQKAIGEGKHAPLGPTAPSPSPAPPAGAPLPAGSINAPIPGATVDFGGGNVYTIKAVTGNGVMLTDPSGGDVPIPNWAALVKNLTDAGDPPIYAPPAGAAVSAPPAPAPTPGLPTIGVTYQHHGGGTYQILGSSATKYKVKWLSGPGAAKTTHGPAGTDYLSKSVVEAAITTGKHLPLGTVGGAPAPAPPTLAPAPAPPRPPASPVTVPGAPPFDPATALTPVGRTAGGYHEKQEFVDAQGRRWMFKPDALAGAAEVSGYSIMRAVGLEAPEAYDVELGGRRGSLQRFHPDVTGPLDPAGLPGLSRAQLARVQEHQVLDWLIAQHDTNEGGLLRGPGDQIYAIDKGQAFKFLGRDRLDWTDKPNPLPVMYNQLWEDYINGRVDLDRRAVAGLLTRIEQLDEADYRRLLTPYAARAFPAAGERTAFLDQAIARKRSLRADIDDLYARAAAERARRGHAPAIAPYQRLDQAFADDVQRQGWAGKMILVGGPHLESGSVLAYELAGPAGARTLVLETRVRADYEAPLLARLRASVAAPLADDPIWLNLLATIRHVAHHMQPGGDQVLNIAKVAPIQRAASAVLAAPPGPQRDYYAAMIKTLTGQDVADVASNGASVVGGWLKAAYRPTTYAPYQPSAAHAVGGTIIDDTGNQGTIVKVHPDGTVDIKDHASQQVHTQIEVTAPLASGEWNYQPPGAGGSSPLPVVMETPYQRERSLRQGVLTTTGARVPDYGRMAYTIDLGQGATAVYTSYDQGNPRSRQGRLQVSVDGYTGTAAELRTALAQLDRLGLPAQLATPADLELLYLRHQAFAAKLEADPSYRREVEQRITPTMTVAEQIAVHQAFWNARLGVPDVTALPSYDPRPRSTRGWVPANDVREGEAGWAHWQRFDITEEQVRTQMADYGLTHSLSTGLIPFLEAALDNNGAMLNTDERGRLGIFRRGSSAGRGMSSERDLSTGGASYVFTRLQRRRQWTADNHLVFDPRLLLRTDNITDDGDTYGRNDKDTLRQRHADMAGWKQAATGSNNETIIKNGFNLLDSLIQINAGSQRAQVLALLRGRGITVIGGRPIEDVVV